MKNILHFLANFFLATQKKFQKLVYIVSTSESAEAQRVNPITGVENEIWHTKNSPSPEDDEHQTVCWRENMHQMPAESSDEQASRSRSHQETHHR